MKAVISDIHGNIEALETVLTQIASEGIDEIWCLGDIVGYGPNPQECVDLVKRNASLCIMGNHDWAVLNEPYGFNEVAARMVYLTKEWMDPTENPTDQKTERWEFLSQLPTKIQEDPFLLVHGSPREALTEYILPGDVDYDPHKLREVFARIDRYCLVGHSHYPCVIDEENRLVIPSGNAREVPLLDRKMVFNVGSVGQPRDGDTRACFVTLEDEVVRYHRVPYDNQKTQQKLRELGEDYEILAARLAAGR